MAVSLKGRGLRPTRGLLRRTPRPRGGVVRVLHNLSFIDDPTRIFRGDPLRESVRLPHGRPHVALARACVEMDLVGELSSRAAAGRAPGPPSEERVGDSVRRMAELGIDRAIHPHLAADEEAVALIEEVDSLRERMRPRRPRGASGWPCSRGGSARRRSRLGRASQAAPPRRRADRRCGRGRTAAARPRRATQRSPRLSGARRAARSGRSAASRSPLRKGARASGWSATSRSSAT